MLLSAKLRLPMVLYLVTASFCEVSKTLLRSVSRRNFNCWALEIDSLAAKTDFQSYLA